VPAEMMQAVGSARLVYLAWSACALDLVRRDWNSGDIYRRIRRERRAPAGRGKILNRGERGVRNPQRPLHFQVFAYTFHSPNAD
ncbi:MAG TPA: hypothetical protein VK788_22910, partial [Terriglobales bacterium]|nr:hypothetical protein [Terriglobales bacterium]